MSNPYSYITTGGVSNTRVLLAPDGTLESLTRQHSKPVQLTTASTAYHTGTKREKGDTKKQLPYFVGGVINGKRHDDNVTARTLLTLDVEQGPLDESPPPPPERVSQLLESLGGSGWVYTSLSHTADSPRYRVVLPLGKPITGTSEEMQAALQASTVAAAKKLGIEAWTKPESWVLSQPMYLPAKLKGGKFHQSVHAGKSWSVVRRVNAVQPSRVGGVEAREEPAAIPDEKPDEVLQGLKVAGMYLGAHARHKGMHNIKCPWHDQHETENDSKTVYYEAHFDGNPRPAVKCMSTSHDDLTYAKLVHWLREQDLLTQEQQDKVGVLDDDDTFVAKASLDAFLATEPTPRVWAVEQFAPVGKVTVVAGPGGVSKSMLALHMLMYAAIGKPFGPFTASEPLKSLYVSYEDDRQEMHKRVHRLVDELGQMDDGVFDALYDIKGTLSKNLLMYAADDDAAAWLLLTKPDRFSPPERTARVEWLVGMLKRNKIRLLMLDPAVYTHQLEENNIADMATFMQTLTSLAKHAQCAVVVIHHMSKAAGWLSLDDVNQASLRGASSFADNARSVGVVVSMPIKDAASYGLPVEHSTVGQYAVFKHVKHNYSASLGTHVFERKGALLMPRPDITKLDSVQLHEAKARQVEQSEEFRVMSSAASVLRFLEDSDDFVSMSQIVTGARVHKRRIRELMQEYADRDWVEEEAGARGAATFRITTAGRGWLQAREAALGSKA